MGLSVFLLDVLFQVFLSEVFQKEIKIADLKNQSCKGICEHKFWIIHESNYFFYIDNARTYDPVSIKIAAIIIFVWSLDSGNSLKYIIPHSMDTKTDVWVMEKPTVSPRDDIVNIPK